MVCEGDGMARESERTVCEKIGWCVNVMGWCLKVKGFNMKVIQRSVKVMMGRCEGDDGIFYESKGKVRM